MITPPIGGVSPAGGTPAGRTPSNALEVFRNRPFLLLWLSQAFTQIGGNMVIYGLTVIILTSTSSKTAVSLLILTFLIPAVLFSALAGVYVDRVDRRTILVVTNLLRGGVYVGTYLAGNNLPLILVLNITVSTITVFFAPAEAAMIPRLLPRKLLIAGNGIFTLTLNGAFAIGFALLGPIVVTLAGASTLILLVAACYIVAAGFCFTLPSAPPQPLEPGHVGVLGDAERAVGSTVAQLREGIDFIRANPSISWSLYYLGIAASLVGVLGVLGTDFATTSLGLAPKDFVVVVLPLSFGIVTGILLLNQFGHLLPRRRIIEGGLVSLGVLLAALAGAGPISRFLGNASAATHLQNTSGLTSLLAVVIAIALLAGVAYGVVAIPSQTQLQEDLPEDVRGRVFGVLNMLVSVASFLPIIVVGPVSDFVGTTIVLLLVAVFVGLSGLGSILTRGPLTEPAIRGHTKARHPGGTAHAGRSADGPGTPRARSAAPVADDPPNPDATEG
jgi:MFS family permease